MGLWHSALAVYNMDVENLEESRLEVTETTVQIITRLCGRITMESEANRVFGESNVISPWLGSVLL